jgi:hypothetical protein
MTNIDVTVIADTVKGSFILWATDFIYAELLAIPGMQWIGLPIIGAVVHAVIKKIVTILADAAILEAFFLTTALQKANQAGTYVAAVDAKNRLPPTATQQEYYAAEQAEIAAFRDFVVVA